jgi:hypothetical protein
MDYSSATLPPEAGKQDKLLECGLDIMDLMEITIASIHKEFVPQYDRWHGKFKPRIVSWFKHIGEIFDLWSKGDKLYSKRGKTIGTCREHAWVEVGDWLYLTAEIFYMLTKIELPIVPKKTLERVWEKMNENRTKFRRVLRSGI